MGPRPRPCRIIPAYAGSTAVGVGHARTLDGSSPHTRGARGRGRHRARLFGIIPAYAGSTVAVTSAGPVVADHPRIRGEHFQRCGERVDGVGSSPHTRGAHVHGTPYPTLGGIIPAYAGSTLLQSQPSPRRKDHPRIRGEHEEASLYPTGYWGSSPHTRGAPRLPPLIRVIDRIIPAYAGSTEIP